MHRLQTRQDLDAEDEFQKISGRPSKTRTSMISDVLFKVETSIKTQFLEVRESDGLLPSNQAISFAVSDCRDYQQ